MRETRSSRPGTRCALVSLALLLGCHGLRAAHPAPEPPAGPATTEELITFVDRAAAELQAKGNAAFGEFGREGGEWKHGDTYVFVVDAATHRILFHGHDPARVGEDLTTIRGAEGRAFGRWGVQGLAGSRDRAWIFYKRARPRGGAPTWKATFLRRVQGPSGERYIVGSGLYDLVPDRRFVVELVDMAAERIERDGRAALALVRDPKGPFVYRDTQVFVIDTKGNVLADPFYPELERKNQIDLKDAAGRPVQRDLVHLVQTEEAGWRTGYLWPRPRGGAPGHKDLYLRRVRLGKQTLGVGSGLFVE